jgi:hypothetical protein
VCHRVDQTSLPHCHFGIPFRSSSLYRDRAETGAVNADSISISTANRGTRHLKADVDPVAYGRCARRQRMQHLCTVPTESLGLEWLRNGPSMIQIVAGLGDRIYCNLYKYCGSPWLSVLESHTTRQVSAAANASFSARSRLTDLLTDLTVFTALKHGAAAQMVTSWRSARRWKAPSPLPFGLIQPSHHSSCFAFVSIHMP